MNSLFQQKQRELVVAVSKVEELSRQLEMLKNGKMDALHDNQSAVAELDRLYRELQVWNLNISQHGFCSMLTVVKSKNMQTNGRSKVSLFISVEGK